MCMKTFGLTKISLTIVINHKIVPTLIKQTRKLLVNSKMRIIPITGFIGLRSKMYSYTKDNNENEKAAKGIKKICDQKGPPTSGLQRHPIQ